VASSYGVPYNQSKGGGSSSGNSHQFYQSLPTPSLEHEQLTVVYIMGASLGILVIVRLGGEAKLQASLFKIGLGTGIVTVGLTLLAGPAPKLAVGFALLVLTTVFLTYGGPFFTHLTTSLGAFNPTASPNPPGQLQVKGPQ
jgi:hypothetical protein